MNKYEKWIKRVGLFIIILSIIVVIIILNIKRKNKQEYIDSYQAKEELDIEKDFKVKPVQVQADFYTVQNIIQKYLSYQYLDINEKQETDNNIMQPLPPTMAQLYGITTEEEKKNRIIDLLDVEYIKKNNISINNIDKYIEIYPGKVKNCKVIEMNTLEGDQIESYSAYVEIDIIEQNGKENKKYNYYIITIDNDNTTFMIEPINEKNSIDNIKLDNNRDSIKSNKYNSFTFVRYNDGEIAERYLEEYKELLLNNPKEAFNRLNVEYREKRFKNIENFAEFVNKNIEEIKGIHIYKHLVNKYNNSTEYVCMDRFQNLYIFNVVAVTKYDVKLDTYTIPTDKFKETYSSSNKQKKVMMNIDKWVQMLNNRDYQVAYNVLDETYRNNTFGEEEQFENLIREKLPLHYKVEYSNFTDENNIYTMDISLSDITTETSENIKMSIVMKLEEELDFVMSFSFEE